MTPARLLVISPVHNEAAHIELVARAMAAQTRAPDTWVVVDDHSDDGTSGILERLASELPFLRVVSCTPLDVAVRDRLAMALEVRAFNTGLDSVDWTGYSHISKLDGDIELPPTYYEELLAEFERDRTLGLAGGALLERVGSGWELDDAPCAHVRGGLKCYSRTCFQAIGGIPERLGWDTLDEVYARMRGFGTRSLPALVARHHRPLASADGVLRGKVRYGRTFYILGFPLPWVALRACKAATERPRIISGIAFFGGYLRAAVGSSRPVDDPAYLKWLRAELRDRVRAAGERAYRAGRGRPQTPLSLQRRTAIWLRARWAAPLASRSGK